ncbi:hypothetical protein Dimus_012550 [Dionaea muscipula]
MDRLTSLPDDPTNPFSPSAANLADHITNLFANPPEGEETSKAKGPSREEVNDLIVSVARKVGTILEQAHIEDLYSIANEYCTLNEHMVYMYLRGVMRTYQISATSSLHKLVASLESVLNKYRSEIKKGSEESKLVSERLNTLAQRIDGLTPSLTSIVQTEHTITRKRIEILAAVKAGTSEYAVEFETDKDDSTMKFAKL